MIACAGAVAPAGASAAGITVRLAGTERHFSPSQIDAAVDRPAGSYLLRAPHTTAEPVAHPPALSMRRLVSLAGASPDSVSFMTIERPNGSLAILRRGDLADPPPFPEGPPIVWVDSGGIRYLRPLRSPSDVNATDNIGVTEGNLELRLHHGRLLGVRAEASRLRVPAGRPTRLSAGVTGATRGEALSFKWTFGDGTGARGRAVRHRFGRPGVYEAVVTVQGRGDSGGSSAPLRIRVGDPPAAPGDTGGGTGDRRLAPAQGPARSRGSDGEGGSTGRESSPSPAHASKSSEPRSPTPARRQRLSPAGGLHGKTISGTLVAASSVAPPGGEAAASRGAVQVAARRGSDPADGSFAWPLAALAAAAALYLGGWRERRQLRARAGLAR